jgi:hypothetical protein
VGNALANVNDHDLLLRANGNFERACDLDKARCGRAPAFREFLAKRCADEDATVVCDVAGEVFGYKPNPDPARSLALSAKACDLGECAMFHPPDEAYYLAVLEVECIHHELNSGGCVTLLDRLATQAGIQRGPDDWLPLFSEAATGNWDPQATCLIDPSPCAHPFPPIPSQAQAVEQRKRILDDHEARCRSGDLVHCEALVRIDALRLAETSNPLRRSPPRRFDPATEWDRLCRAGLRTSCLDRGLLKKDEGALRRACELGEPMGCTRAYAAALARGDRAGGTPYRQRACRLGRTWACE